MKKILYLSHDGLTDPLGESQVLSYLIGLEQKGISYDIISFEKTKNKDKVERINNLIKNHDINWKKLVYRNKPFLIGTILSILLFYVKIIFRIANNKPDLIHSRSYLMTFIALSLKKIFKIKVIFDIRGFWIDEKIESNSWGPSQRFLIEKVLRLLENWSYKNADRIITLTNSSKKEVERKFLIKPDKITVIPTCVNNKLFIYSESARRKLRSRYKISDKQVVLIYSGAIGGYYDFDKMIDIFTELKKIKTDALFFILSRVDHGYIREKLSSRAINETDFYIHSCEINEVAQYLSMSDIGLILYNNSYSSLARCPTKMGEYINCNLKVIAPANVGDLDYIFKLDNNIGRQFKGFNLVSYQESLKVILEMKKSKVRNGFNYFSLESGIEKYFSIYKTL